WIPAKDTDETYHVGTGQLQGFPFIIYGHITTGIDEYSNLANEFVIADLYPVPAKDQISFDLHARLNVDVILSLHDYLGRELLSQQKNLTPGKNNIILDLSKQS